MLYENPLLCRGFRIAYSYTKSLPSCKVLLCQLHYNTRRKKQTCQRYHTLRGIVNTINIRLKSVKYFGHCIPPKLSVSGIMGYLKGKSSLMIFDRFANLKYRYGNRQFWCRGYYVDTVGRNRKKIEEYIRNQLSEDKLSDDISRKELYDLFTGEAVVTRGKK